MITRRLLGALQPKFSLLRSASFKDPVVKKQRKGKKYGETVPVRDRVLQESAKKERDGTQTDFVIHEINPMEL